MADVVFIVGAGCSVHAGAPIMSNFLERARDLLASKEVEDRREEFGTTFEVVSYLQRVHSKARLDHNNIESVFSAVDLVAHRGPNRSSRRPTPKSAGPAQRALRVLQ